METKHFEWKIPVRGYYTAAAVYLALPLLLFLFGWVQWWLAAPLAIGVVYAAWKFSHLGAGKEHIVTWRALAVMVLGVILLHLWVYYSGIGYFALQSHDFHARNGTFEDLVNYDWPVTYPDGKILNYYFGFWLPAAFAAKFVGLEAGKYLLHLWTLAGISLVWGALCIHSQRISILSVLILILWGSFLHVYGQIAFWLSRVANLPPMYDVTSEYGYNTVELYDLHNSFLVTAMVALLFLRDIKTSHAVFLFAACSIMSPMGCAAMLPLMAVVLARKCKQRGFVPDLFSVQSVSCGLFGMVAVWFFLANSGVGGTMGVDLSAIISPNQIKYFVAFLPWLVFLAPSHYRNPIFWISSVMLLILPAFVIKASANETFQWNDMAAKGFVPYSIILMAMVSKRLFLGKNVERLICALMLLWVGSQTCKTIIKKVDYSLHPDPDISMINRRWNNTLDIPDKSIANFYADELPFVFRRAGK